MMGFDPPFAATEWVSLPAGERRCASVYRSWFGSAVAFVWRRRCTRGMADMMSHRGVELEFRSEGDVMGKTEIGTLSPAGVKLSILKQAPLDDLRRSCKGEMNHPLLLWGRVSRAIGGNMRGICRAGRWGGRRCLR